MADGNTALDILGIKGVSDSIKIATEHVFAGASAFLSKVCLPAAEEIGLVLKDRVSSFRAKNAAKIFSEANDMIVADKSLEGQQIHPRLVHLAFDEGSWCDDEDIQHMWAGLLASSVSSDGKSDDNLIFLNILKQLSFLQVKILNYAVQRSNKYDAGLNLPMAHSLIISADELRAAFGIHDIQRLDRELDHLTALGLLGSGLSGAGFNVSLAGKVVDVTLTPSAMCLHLFVRSQGSKLSPVEYWSLKSEHKEIKPEIEIKPEMP